MNKILQVLFNQFVKQYGRKPNNLETILLKQKAMNEALDKRKVISMVDRQPVNPNKPIMGGTQEVTEDTGKGFIDFVRKTDPEGAAKLQKTEDKIRAAIEAGNKRAAENLRKKKSKKLDDPEEKAEGGRIGLAGGTTLKEIALGMNDGKGPRTRQDFIQLYKIAGYDSDVAGSLGTKHYKTGFAQDDVVRQIGFATGGRIGLKEGEGIMQMASVDEPFFRDDYLDENAQMMFKKQYKDLTPDELEEFREEMMRLMNKFSSAPDPMDERNTVMENIAMDEFGKPLKDLTPKQIEFLEEALEEMSKKPTVPRMMASAPDPMDERNTVMENIAIDQFGKPLKDLSEEEIIQIEEMMDEMSIKKDRGAPSIKLAAEGGIMRVGLKDGTGMFEKLFFNKESPILSGLNTSALFDLAVAAKDFAGPLIGLAEGGRIGYKDGPPDPTKRKFMKAAVGLASVLPFGIGKGVKMAAPVVAKAAELTGPALAKIVETVMDFGKLISVKGRRVKEMVTKKKHQGVEVTEDISDGSYIIKKDNKEIYYKPGRMDETGGVEDDIIEILEDTVTKKAGGGIARMLGE